MCGDVRGVGSFYFRTIPSEMCRIDMCRRDIYSIFYKLRYSLTQLGRCYYPAAATSAAASPPMLRPVPRLPAAPAARRLSVAKDEASSWRLHAAPPPACVASQGRRA